MKQGVLTNQRVRLLFKKGMSCFRERRNGSRKRKSASPPKKDALTKCLEAIVKNLNENDTNGWFGKPVDISEVPDYPTVIKCGRHRQPCPLLLF